jgi:hypothetical protein
MTNQGWIKAALVLVELLDGDEAVRKETEAYGDWFNHLVDHLAEVTEYPDALQVNAVNQGVNEGVEE